MTGAELKEFFEELVGDSPSDLWFFTVLSSKKDELEASRQWAYLRKTDTSIARSASDTWQTAKALPADFALPLSAFVGDAMSAVEFVPFEALNLKDTDGTARIDLANSCLYFNGTAGTTGTLYLTYQRFTDTIASGTTPTMPARFHKLLPYDAAKAWFAKDQSERGLAWNAEHAAEAESIRAAMERWDERIKASEASQQAVSLAALNLN